MEKLIEWLNQHKVNTDNLKIIDQPNNERGVISAKHIKKDEFVFLIPKHLLITNRTAEQLPEIKHLDNVFQNKTPTEKSIIKISVFMLFAEEFEGIMSTVDWTPYFDTLPETLDHIPIFWKEDLEYIRGSYLYERIRERNRLIREEYRVLKNNIPDFDVFRFYDYHRMRSLVSSRNFKLTINGDIVSAMVPFADMLNHSNTCQTRWSYNDQLQSYQMVAKTPISSGYEIMDSYGIKSMDSYFIYYGFVLPDSYIRIYVKTSDFKGYINNINSNDFRSLLNYIRNKQSSSDIFINKYQDRHSESKVMEQVNKLLNQIKKKYPHTANYYNKHKMTGPQNKKNAYTLMAGELEVIEDLMDKVTIIIKYLNGKKVKLYDDVEKYVLDNIIRQ
tara:strand:- start:3590 stop:4753 length:1164 start_codon:yes stop_codon:yes gene_type:complete